MLHPPPEGGNPFPGFPGGGDSYTPVDSGRCSDQIQRQHRLKTESFEPYFEGHKKLMPKPTDLSYYNWETQTSTSNSTPNFQVISDNEAGLLFKNKRDRKIINVDSTQNPGDNSNRVEVQTDEYLQVVIYDHMTRRKS